MPQLWGFPLSIGALHSTNLANPAIDYYHVRCFENLLDMSSLSYAMRFDADRSNNIPNLGARCILKAYISRWKLRLTQTSSPESSTSVLGESTSTPVVSDGKSPITSVSASVRARKLISAAKAAIRDDESSVTGWAKQLLLLARAAARDHKWAIADEMDEKEQKIKTERWREAAKWHPLICRKSLFLTILSIMTSNRLFNKMYLQAPLKIGTILTMRNVETRLAPGIPHSTSHNTFSRNPIQTIANGMPLARHCNYGARIQ